MNKNQYNNIIKHTIENEIKNSKSNNLENIRKIFKNLGVAFPSGDTNEVLESLKSDKFMDWRSCTEEEARAAANNGTASLVIDDDKILILTADNGQNTSSIYKDFNVSGNILLSDEKPNLKYYSYNSSGTRYWVDDYDAIYVSLYGDDGLEVVGHAYAFLKISTGKWIKTEFNTPGGRNIKEKKANSKVYITRNFSSADVQYILLKGFRELTMSDGFTSNVYTDGLEFFPIEGNFAQSISRAKSYEGTNYGGYNFLSRNCLHYIKEILKAGYAYDCRIENVLENSEIIEPKGYLRALKNSVT